MNETTETQVLQDALFFLNSSLTLFLRAPSSLTHSLLLSECLWKQTVLETQKCQYLKFLRCKTTVYSN